VLLTARCAVGLIRVQRPLNGRRMRQNTGAVTHGGARQLGRPGERPPCAGQSDAIRKSNTAPTPGRRRAGTETQRRTSSRVAPQRSSAPTKRIVGATPCRRARMPRPEGAVSRAASHGGWMRREADATQGARRGHETRGQLAAWTDSLAGDDRRPHTAPVPLIADRKRRPAQSESAQPVATDTPTQEAVSQPLPSDAGGRRAATIPSGDHQAPSSTRQGGSPSGVDCGVCGGR